MATWIGSGALEYEYESEQTCPECGVTEVVEVHVDDNGRGEVVCEHCGAVYAARQPERDY